MKDWNVVKGIGSYLRRCFMGVVCIFNALRVFYCLHIGDSAASLPEKINLWR